MKYVMVIKTKRGDEYMVSLSCENKEQLEETVDKMSEIVNDMTIFNCETIDGRVILLPKNILQSSVFEFYDKEYFD